MNAKKQLVINMIASVVATLVSAGISFVLSPYIIENVGSEAYGFVQLTNNIVSYFAIITVALNSMTSRFVSVSFFQGKIDEAKGYYSSSFFANLFLCIIFTPIFIVGIIHIDKMIHVSKGLLGDVQILMSLLAVDFILCLLFSNIGVAYYIRNKLYISSIINIVANIVRVIIIVVLYVSFKPYISYIAVATLGMTIITQIFNLYYRKKLIPELYIQKSYYKLEKVKTLFFSGIWNSITRLGALLQEGLDLLITNLMISSEDMGTLAVAKTVPSLINALLNTIMSSFMPNFTELFAKQEKEKLVYDIKQAMKIIGMMINIPIAILIGYGDVFFKLWVPSQDAELLQFLSILTIAPWAVMGQATIIHNIFTVVNKIKTNSVLVCFTGLLNIGIVYVLLRNTSLGIVAVAGVSSLLSILRNLCYTVPYGAIYIQCPWYTFFPEIGKSIVSVVIISCIGKLFKMTMPGISWIYLVIYIIITGLVGIIFNCFAVLNREDRMFIRNKMKVMKKNGKN